MDTSPEPRDVGEPDSWRPEDEPGAAQLLARSAASLATNPVRAARVSAGIVLKSGQVSTDEWMAALGQALAEQAKRSQATRQALERLLNG